MYIEPHGLIILLVVGLVAGWLAGKIWRGAGFGIIGDIVIGIIGAFIGSWLLPRLGIHSIVHNLIVDNIIFATIGALVLLGIISLIRRL
jgi:uncharacterized membrane protein YeaQ/YmgE (transglycosylase-associated protein family)